MGGLPGVARVPGEYEDGPRGPLHWNGRDTEAHGAGIPFAPGKGVAGGKEMAGVPVEWLHCRRRPVYIVSFFFFSFPSRAGV